MLQPVQSWIQQQDATPWWRNWWSVVDSLHAGHSMSFTSFWISFAYTRSTSMVGSTTLPWCWCFSTAASTLSSTPPSIVSSRQVWDAWYRRFVQGRELAALLEIEQSLDYQQLYCLLLVIRQYTTIYGNYCINSTNTPWVKKHATLHLCMTLAYINWFLNLFHRWIHQEIFK